MLKDLRSLENYLQNSLLLVKLLVLLTEEWIPKKTCPSFKQTFVSDVLMPVWL